MENVNGIKAVVLTIIGGVGSYIVDALGGWGEDMTTLVIFMGIDLLLGLLIAGVWKKSGKSQNGALSSWSAWKGIVRKGVSLLVVLIAHRIDISLGVDYMRTAVILAFCADELISIVENLGIMGVPLPNVIKTAIDIFKSKSDGKTDEDKQ